MTRVAALLLLFFMASAADQATAQTPVNFHRDIRPILSANCFQCHGPDEKQRKAHLRLDTKDGAFADLDGSFAIVPGKPQESKLLQRITADDPEERMPPPKSGKKLSPGTPNACVVPWAIKFATRISPPERDGIVNNR